VRRRTRSTKRLLGPVETLLAREHTAGVIYLQN